MAVGYSKEDPAGVIPIFQSLQEWNAKKSTKMDACARICAHYLQDDRIDDVDFQDGEPVFPQIHATWASEPQRTRRIIVYAEFPSMAPLLQNVGNHLHSSLS